MGQIGAGLDPIDHSKLDIPVLDPRLPSLEAGRGLEVDRDRRASLAIGRIGKPNSDECGDDGKSPDRRQVTPMFDRRLGESLGCGRLVGAHGYSPAASHISRGSKQVAAIMVVMTTAAKAIAPVPGSMVAIAPRRTSPTRIEIMKTSIIDHRPTDSTMR